MRKRNWIKGLAAAMSVMLAAQMLAGCGKEKAENGGQQTGVQVKETGLPIVEEQQTLKVMVLQDYPELKGEDIVLHQEIQAATNVKIEWEMVPSASWEEKKGLVLSQSELPDIIMGNNVFTDTDMLNMAEAKQIIPLNDLIDQYGENFKNVCAVETNLMASLTASDGNIYALPRYIGVGDGTGKGILNTNNVTYINQKWLDNLGLAMPTTTEEFKQVLLAFKEQDANQNGDPNDEIPFTAVKDAYFDDWFGAFGIVPNNNENNYENIGLKDGKVIFSAIQPEYKEAIRYFNELWELGVLDPETFTQDSTMFNAKLKNPERNVGVFEAWRGTSWRLDENDTEYVVMPPLTGPEGDSLYPKMYNGISSRCAFVITSSCKNPELAMRWGDYLLEPDNAYQFWTGAKIGYNIQENSEGIFDLIKQINVTDPEQMKQVAYGFTCVDINNEARKPLDPDPLNVDNEKRASDVYFQGHYPQEHYPNVFLSMEESKKISEIAVDINSYVDQQYAKWITKGGVDEEWDAYVKKIEGMRLDEYLAQYQAAYDRYVGAK